MQNLSAVVTIQVEDRERNPSTCNIVADSNMVAFNNSTRLCGLLFPGALNTPFCREGLTNRLRKLCFYGMAYR